MRFNKDNDDSRLITKEENDKVLERFLKAWSNKDQKVAFDLAVAHGRYMEHEFIFGWLEHHMAKYVLGETSLHAKEAYTFSIEFVKMVKHHLG